MHKLRALPLLLLFTPLLTLGQSDSMVQKSTELKPVQLLMKNLSNGDFGFQNEWSYPEGVYKNQWGQLSCDGLCPEGVEKMKDDQGKIKEDFLTDFYALVDTTHLPHTIQCEASMYEFAGTNFIEFAEIENGVIGTTRANAATHSTLSIQIKDGVCYAWVNFNSIQDQGIDRFDLQVGRMILDKTSFEDGIIKGSFDFRFMNHLDAEKPLYWRGTILSTVDLE